MSLEKTENIDNAEEMQKETEVKKDLVQEPSTKQETVSTPLISFKEEKDQQLKKKENKKQRKKKKKEERS